MTGQRVADGFRGFCGKHDLREEPVVAFQALVHPFVGRGPRTESDRIEVDDVVAQFDAP